MMDWLTTLIERLTCWIPRLQLVQPDEAGIRTTLGSRIKAISSGWYVFWPLIQDITVLTVSTQIKDVREQSLTTRDGKNVIVGGAIRYKITDAKKSLLNVIDYDSALQTLVIGAISSYISHRDYEDCRDINDLEELLLKKVREAASGFGLKIMQVFITDFCKADTYRIVGIVPVVGGMLSEEV